MITLQAAGIYLQRIRRKVSAVWAPLILIAFGCIYSLGYLRLSSRWWFEDDPALFAYTASAGSPIRFFADPTILRRFTTGNALVPMQLISYWLDLRTAGVSPAVAYLHQTVSFLITIVLIMRFSRDGIGIGLLRC